MKKKYNTIELFRFFVLSTGEESKLKWLKDTFHQKMLEIVFFFPDKYKFKFFSCSFIRAFICLFTFFKWILNKLFHFNFQTYVSTALLACFVCFGLVCFQTSGKAEIDKVGKVSLPNNVFFQVSVVLIAIFKKN